MVSFMQERAGTVTQHLRRAVSQCFWRRRREKALILQGEGADPVTMVADPKQRFRAGSSRKGGVRSRGSLVIQRSSNTGDQGLGLNMRHFPKGAHSRMG